MRELHMYSVGQVIEQFAAHKEEVLFDIDDGGATLLIFFNDPTEKEIEQFSAGKSFEIRFTELYSIIMVTAKIGELNWIDAPYTIHLSKNLSNLAVPEDGQGLALTLMLIDGNNGQIKNIRLLGLSKEFTTKLYAAILRQSQKEFSKPRHYENLSKVFNRYKTDEIVKMGYENRYRVQ